MLLQLLGRCTSLYVLALTMNTHTTEVLSNCLLSGNAAQWTIRENSLNSLYILHTVILKRLIYRKNPYQIMSGYISNMYSQQAIDSNIEIRTNRIIILF